MNILVVVLLIYFGGVMIFGGLTKLMKFFQGYGLKWYTSDKLNRPYGRNWFGYAPGLPYGLAIKTDSLIRKVSLLVYSIISIVLGFVILVYVKPEVIKFL